VLLFDVPNTVPEFHESLRNAGARYEESGNSWEAPTRALRAAARLAREWRPSIIHTHFINPLMLPALRIISRGRIYTTFHSGIEREIGLGTRVASQFRQTCSHRLLAVSERVRRDYVRAGVSPSRISTLYLGLDIEGLAVASNACLPPAPKGYDDTTLRKVITVGRFHPVKGMLYSVRAAVEVLLRFPDVLWWVVGKEGPDSPAAAQIIKQSGLESRLLLLGQRNDVPNLMKQAHLQVVGSRSEGLPLMVLEASALGVPTVAPNIGGMDEAVQNGVTGLLVQPASHEELARAAVRLLSNDAERRAMGAEAARLVRERFDARRQVHRLLDLFESDHGAAVGPSR
jgi:glycosyltransferase involved in cell wall biosynthesis